MSVLAHHYLFYEQVAAENYIINQSWDANGVSSNLVDFMVYSGATSLDWTKSYTNGPDQWSGDIFINVFR